MVGSNNNNNVNEQYHGDSLIRGGSEHTTQSQTTTTAYTQQSNNSNGGGGGGSNRTILSVLASRATQSDAERRKLEAFATTTDAGSTTAIDTAGGGSLQKKNNKAPTPPGDEDDLETGVGIGSGAGVGVAGGFWNRMVENLANEIDVDEWQDEGGYENWKHNQRDEKIKEREQRRAAARAMGIMGPSESAASAAKASSVSTLDMVFGKGVSSTSISTTAAKEKRKIADYEQGSRSFRAAAAAAVATQPTTTTTSMGEETTRGSGSAGHWMGRLIQSTNPNLSAGQQPQHSQQMAAQHVAPLPPGESATMMFEPQPGAYSGIPGRGLMQVAPVRFSVLNNNNTPQQDGVMMMADPSSLAFSSASSKSTRSNLALFEDEPTSSTRSMTGSSGGGGGNQRIRRNQSSRSRLAVANPIYEEDEPTDLPQAQGIDVQQHLDASERRHYQNKIKQLQYWLAFVSLLAIVILVMAIVVTIFVPDWGSGSKSGDNDTMMLGETIQPTTVPSQSPTLSTGGYVKSLLPESTVVAIAEDPSSPQALAYDWVMEDPNLATYSQDRIRQRYALGVFYYATNGPQWRQNQDWLSYEKHECEWYAANTHQMFVAAGIMRNLQKAYQDIVLPLVSEESACQDRTNPQTFTHLLLVLNNMKGSLPQELFMMTSLRGILLALNPDLTGPGIPTQIVRLPRLETFLMVGAQFTGTIPTQIGSLRKLKTLNFSNNLLHGSLPSQLGRLSDTLELLDFSRNRMTGTMPIQLGQLSQLALFNNHHNDEMIGTIPSELGKLTRVSFLSISRSKLEGRIPSQLGMLTQLKELYFYANNLVGTVPLELANLVPSSGTGDGATTSSTLEILHLHNNLLSGSIPPQLCSIETISEATPLLHPKQSSLVGCPCNCTYEYPPWNLCSPLPDKCLPQS